MKSLMPTLILFLMIFTLSACEGLDGLLDDMRELAITLEGDFTASGSDASLEGFNYLEIIGNLHIFGTDLPHLNELSSLTRVTGDIVIEDNIELTNINGLGYLMFVGGDIIFDNNDKINLVNAENLVRNIYKRGGWVEGSLIFNGTIVPIDEILVDPS